MRLEGIGYGIVNAGYMRGFLISNILKMGSNLSGEEDGGCNFGRVWPQPFR
jgi:hypothetical protein